MVTPARKQYLDIKAKHPDAIVLFRLGDFYEMFDDDAKKGAEALKITLTSRSFGKDTRVPLAGVPYHALDNALSKLLAAGHRVAICEQMSPPGRGLIERSVVRVLTPGTLVEPSLLTGDRNNYIAAVFLGRYSIGLAYADVSTGEFAVAEFSGADGMAELDAEIGRLRPAEVLVAEGHVSIGGGRWHVAPVPESTFDEARARESLMRVLGVRSLDGFGCSGMGPGISAAGAILLYLERTNPASLGLLSDLRVASNSGFMPLDEVTLRRLEILENDRNASSDKTLIQTIDRTKTPIGARLLRRWLLRPLVHCEELERRLTSFRSLLKIARLLLKRPRSCILSPILSGWPPEPGRK